MIELVRRHERRHHAVGGAPACGRATGRVQIRAQPVCGATTAASGIRRWETTRPPDAPTICTVLRPSTGCSRHGAESSSNSSFIELAFIQLAFETSQKTMKRLTATLHTSSHVTSSSCSDAKSLAFASRRIRRRSSGCAPPRAIRAANTRTATGHLPPNRHAERVRPLPLALADRRFQILGEKFYQILSRRENARSVAGSFGNLRPTSRSQVLDLDDAAVAAAAHGVAATRQGDGMRRRLSRLLALKVLHPRRHPLLRATRGYPVRESRPHGCANPEWSCRDITVANRTSTAPILFHFSDPWIREHCHVPSTPSLRVLTATPHTLVLFELHWIGPPEPQPFRLFFSRFSIDMRVQRTIICSQSCQECCVLGGKWLHVSQKNARNFCSYSSQGPPQN